jgi:long-chain acyl-CoA synthetase
VLVGEDFSTGNDMLTPSLKLKRRNVLARYGEQIEALYKSKAPRRESAAPAV